MKKLLNEGNQIHSFIRVCAVRTSVIPFYYGPGFISLLYLIGGPADLIMAIIEMAAEGAEEPLLATQATVRDPGLVPRDLSRLLVLRHPQVLGRRGGRRGDIAVSEVIGEVVRMGVGPLPVILHQEGRERRGWGRTRRRHIRLNNKRQY
jgi:hypothetical protein